jgi:hypothetical protein
MKTAKISIVIVVVLSALVIYVALAGLVDSAVVPWLLTATVLVTLVFAGLIFFWAQNYVTGERKYTQEKLNLQRIITFDVSKVGEMAINDFPFGIVMYQDQEGYPIRWVNRFIESVLPMSLFDQSVAVIDESIVTFLEQGYTSFEIQLATKDGAKFFQFINQTEHNVLFVTDLSAVRQAEQQLLNQRQMIGYLSIENLDDTIQSLTIQDSVNLQGNFITRFYSGAKRIKCMFVG